MSRTEPLKPLTDYDYLVQSADEWLDRQNEGKVVIWPEDRELQQTRQGILRYFMNVNHDDICLTEWIVLVQNIPDRSGRHRHQGGVMIFALDGDGATEMDDVVHDWSEGDLVILPMKPDGVVHQHFNRTADGTPARWCAFSNTTIFHYVGNRQEQVALAPTAH
jgi:hypothetical protein